MNEESKKRYQRIIQDLGQIPTMPTIAAKVMQIVNDPHSSAEDVAKFISRDVALTSKVLRLANSAFYGIPRTISSVNSAIVILGFNTIRSLVLSASVLKVFPQKPGLAASFDRKAFWKHSFMVGIASRMVAQIYRKKRLVDMETAFSAGLLHDIGKIILEQFSNDDYVPVLKAAKEQRLPLVMVEKSMLGMSHADVSGMLVDKWQMPNELKGPIVHHHSPMEDKTSQDMACIVHYANHLCHVKGSGCMDNETYAPLIKDVEAVLGLGITEESLLEELEKHIQEAEPFFSLIEAN
ncbi:MAG: HDOD domain-containing protein [Fibrobacteria bacterium]